MRHAPGQTLQESLSSSLDADVAAEQVATLFRHVTFGVVAATAGAVILSGAIWWVGSAPPLTAAIWSGYIALCAATHILLRHSYGRARPSATDWQLWARRFTAIALAEGFGWGWAPLYLVHGGFDVRLLREVRFFPIQVLGPSCDVRSIYDVSLAVHFDW